MITAIQVNVTSITITRWVKTKPATVLIRAFNEDPCMTLTGPAQWQAVRTTGVRYRAVKQTMMQCVSVCIGASVALDSALWAAGQAVGQCAARGAPLQGQDQGGQVHVLVHRRGRHPRQCPPLQVPPDPPSISYLHTASKHVSFTHLSRLDVHILQIFCPARGAFHS